MLAGYYDSPAALAQGYADLIESLEMSGVEYDREAVLDEYEEALRDMMNPK
jgi:hypothetical protein